MSEFDKETLRDVIRDGVREGIKESINFLMPSLMFELRNIVREALAKGREPETAYPMPAPEFKGADLRELRRHLGITQDEMGERLGIHITTISRMEKDERKVPKTVVKLAEEIMKKENIRKLVNFKI